MCDAGSSMSKPSRTDPGHNDPVSDIEIWDVEQVAAELDVKPATVRSYLARGQMPAPDGRVSGAPWWKPATIHQWKANRTPTGRD